MGFHDYLFQNVIGAKITIETWNCLLKAYEAKDLANKLFLKHHFFAYKMNATNSILNHINKLTPWVSNLK
jgi:hypothetical protein